MKIAPIRSGFGFDHDRLFLSANVLRFTGVNRDAMKYRTCDGKAQRFTSGATAELAASHDDVDGSLGFVHEDSIRFRARGGAKFYRRDEALPRRRMIKRSASRTGSDRTPTRLNTAWAGKRY